MTTSADTAQRGKRGTLRECEDALRSTLEDWMLVGLKFGHALPVMGGLDLNKEPTREPVDTVSTPT